MCDKTLPYSFGMLLAFLKFMIQAHESLMLCLCDWDLLPCVVTAFIAFLLCATTLISSPFLLLSFLLRTWVGLQGNSLAALSLFSFAFSVEGIWSDTSSLFSAQCTNASATFWGAWMRSYVQGRLLQCCPTCPASSLNKACSNWPWKGFETVYALLLHSDRKVVMRTCCFLGVTAKTAYNCSIIWRFTRTWVVACSFRDVYVPSLLGLGLHDHVQASDLNLVSSELGLCRSVAASVLCNKNKLR